MPDKFASQQERELIRRAMDATARYGKGAAEGAGQALGDQYLALGGRGVPYGGLAAPLAEERLAAERDAFISENSGKPWYEQAYDMAAGVAQAPVAIARGIGSADPEGAGEQMGAASVPNAYGYATKPKEMLQASPLEAGMAMAGAITPGKKLRIPEVSYRTPKDRFRTADRIRRTESRIENEVPGAHGVWSRADGRGYYSMPEGADADLDAVSRAWQLGYSIDSGGAQGMTASLDALAPAREYTRRELRESAPGMREMDLDGLRRSIEKEGLRDPLVVEFGNDGRRLIGEGNHRYEALSDMGEKSAPIRPFFVQGSTRPTSAERGGTPTGNAMDKIRAMSTEEQDALLMMLLGR